MTRAPAAEDPAKEDRSPVLFARRWLKRQTDKTLISDMVRGLLDQIDIEGAAWKRLSMVELAAENESAMEHVVHWEGRALRAEAEAARLREALLTVLGDAEHGQHMTWPERIKIGRDAAALAPTPPAVATVAPEGPSEAAKKVAWIIENLIHAAGKGAEFDKLGDDLAVAIDSLAGRGRA